MHIMTEKNSRTGRQKADRKYLHIMTEKDRQDRKSDG